MITLLLLAMSLTLAAQTSPGSDASFLSGDQKMVRMAIDSSIFIVRQEYTLTNRSGNEYGRNGRSYFGRAYSLGVKANNRIWTNSQILRPWDNDGNYDKFRAIDTIKPRLSGTYVRQVVQSGYVTVTADTAGGNKSSTGQGYDSAIATYRAPDSLPNIELVKNNRDKTGWLAVVATKEPIATNDSLPVSYTIYKAQPQFSTTGNKGYIKNMPVRESVIGGVYYLSTVRLGRITFYAAGVLEKDKDGWYIRLFTDPASPMDQLNNLR